MGESNLFAFRLSFIVNAGPYDAFLIRNRNNSHRRLIGYDWTAIVQCWSQQLSNGPPMYLSRSLNDLILCVAGRCLPKNQKMPRIYHINQNLWIDKWRLLAGRITGFHFYFRAIPFPNVSAINTQTFGGLHGNQYWSLAAGLGINGL